MFSSLQSGSVPQQTSIHSVRLYNTSLAAIDELQCVDLIVDAIESGIGGWCVTVNLENLRKAVADPKVHQLVESSTLRVADGITLVWASWLRGTPLPERVCGSNLIHSLTRAIAAQGRSIFLLGGNPGTADKAAHRLQQDNPGLQIAGTYCPPLGFERNPSQVEAIKNMLQAAQPDVIYVALGFPKSEQLITQLRHLCPNAWWIGVGISFSYVVGDIKRPPRWAQNLGVETLYRLIQEPRRLARRYLLDGPIFVVQLFAVSLIQRFKP
ncbi:WecB/TagA/CpsF family glycosyltransferase [Microcoleus sp. FACHB-1515]|uniref:WecB/TagA/CpsF family glycosyltransferase n=1 Tax=Cyanophyceae TaxID=3028117 RepID=UPI0016884BFB|nr:WecB/TagA/CpsF family glycosyltransferase [Microcoleus sp. FACHB-1515]MBD2090795.1 WecB/TagA/CpsF family glycosyltransferase [Microcoleus sp. FACHB-1515]